MSFDAIIVWLSDGENSLAAAQVAVALVTALATLALWRVTRVLAVETSALAKMTSRPFVVCALESSGASAVALNLALRNTGNATAFDIKLEMSPALPKPNGDKPDDETLPTHEISLLPPDQALQIQGVMGTEVYGKVFDMKVSWAAMPGAESRETLSYKIEPKDGFRGGWNTKGPHHIAEELEKLRKQMAKR
ncbi:hypothetical protein [Roseobacter sp.]|uniref:hypothetical protein n=1 Tax=Roseobacter sp. TaxID=1907202 RepID=UPI0025EB4609|nr:hypothetical protein [Roseobacter sp.]